MTPFKLDWHVLLAHSSCCRCNQVHGGEQEASASARSSAEHAQSLVWRSQLQAASGRTARVCSRRSLHHEGRVHQLRKLTKGEKTEKNKHKKKEKFLLYCHPRILTASDTCLSISPISLTSLYDELKFPTTSRLIRTLAVVSVTRFTSPATG